MSRLGHRWCRLSSLATASTGAVPPWPAVGRNVPRARSNSAAISPIMIVAAFVLPPTTAGMIDASATRSPVTPRTWSAGSSGKEVRCGFAASGTQRPASRCLEGSPRHRRAPRNARVGRATTRGSPLRRYPGPGCGHAHPGRMALHVPDARADIRHPRRGLAALARAGGRIAVRRAPEPLSRCRRRHGAPRETGGSGSPRPRRGRTPLRRCASREPSRCCDVSVADVGAEIGFGNASHFTVFFERECGIAPLAYRRSVMGAAAAS